MSVFGLKREKDRLRHTMFNNNFSGIPPHKVHWPNWLGDRLLGVIPCVPVPENSSSIISMDVNMVTRDSKSGMVVLEENWICIIRISPVGQIVRKTPDPSPFDRNIVKNRI